MTQPIGRSGLARINTTPVASAGFPSASPLHAVAFDHFLGDSLDAKWNVAEGTDAATSDAAILASGAGGTLRVTTGDTGTGLAADMICLNQALQYKANGGGISAELKIALSAITTCYMFFGFTDTVAHEAPVESAGSANTLTSNATDAVGFMFDTRMSSDTFWLTGVKADVDAAAQNSDAVPVPATNVTLRVDVDSTGAASFFVNGLMVGSVMANAVAPSAALTPVLALGKTSVAASMTADVDYLASAMRLA